MFKKLSNKNKQPENHQTQQVISSNAKEMTKKELREIRKKDKSYIKNKEVCSLKNSPGNIIEVRDVKKYYLSGSVSTLVLKEINLEIKEGELAILYGKSGSGKSTLLNLISGLDRVSKGHIIVANNNLSCLSDSKLTLFRRKHVSFIFQSYNLLQNLTGYDNVLTGSYLQKDKSKILDIDQLFKDFEIEAIKDKYPSQMSGGQQQRISILRALIKNSDIIFADEPTGALDEATSKIVLKLLQEINRKYKTTVVMVSHDPHIAQIADKVIYIENGHIKKVEINKNPLQL
ncbi:ABC transporter ATP-binding protein [Mycoplasma iguanae]|uniref:ABC transporter ATP-binding protein n=1 Tax=Mycoplasma iguanae TaxID=292461 RepID=A0ABY5R7E3_9MOLU|nr:ABC transporter ATP-binding protein [Mycoplasma iguanae]UVD81428.1 ABC transporter ATP-binding protein [Mycoplasma iguanae]